jgi:hypothetical protein
MKARWDFALTGINTVLNQEGYSRWNELNELYGVAGVQQTLKWNVWLFEVRPELRLLASEAYQPPTTDPFYPNLSFSDRKFQLGQSLQSSTSNQTYLDLETLYLKLQLKRFEVMVGRQALNIGIIKNFPIWNKFSSFNLLNTRIPLQPGVDQINARIQGGNWWLQGLAVFGAREEQNAFLGIAGFPLDFLEFQLLYSQWWEEGIAGFNLQKELGGFLLKTEWLFVGTAPADRDQHTEGALALEYAFNESWSSTAEFIYFSVGAGTDEPVPMTAPSKYFPLRSADYLLWQLEWQVTPFWNVSTIPVINLVDSSTFFTMAVRKNISDNSDITLQLKIPVGSSQTEFSPRTFEFNNSSYLGVSQTAALQFKMYF